ncbi:hypothetical protein [Pragia fontium]|uniref:DUF2380 domain-containing protein n=1 Tax=Pragia fontium DSM 5563 = ATCC 49100 TaxID=1122977 RepID=A0AAJ4W7C9_9GAMM|nr:hypothetical protein [Pragia fontium]SFB96136.1 hypothetical protein SAMN02745723_10140 [Pragia fontium DSM 5563 = ATCC 49100]
MISIRKLLWASIVCLASLCSSFTSALAGAPGPYRLVFLDISEPPYQDGQKLAIELRKLDKLPQEQNSTCFLCNGAQDNYEIGSLYLYSIPVGLSVEELRKAVNGDDNAKRSMQTVLEKFVDHRGVGVDGILIYLHQEGKVTIYTMDRKVGSKLESISKPVKSHLLHSSLDTLLEKAAWKLERRV